MIALPSDILEAIGRSVVQATELELSLAALASIVTGRDVWDIMGKPGEPARAAAAAVQMVAEPARSVLASRVAMAQDLLTARSKVVHSLFANDLSGGSPPALVVFHPRSLDEGRIDRAALDALSERLGAATAGMYGCPEYRGVWGAVWSDPESTD